MRQQPLVFRLTVRPLALPAIGVASPLTQRLLHHRQHPFLEFRPAHIPSPPNRFPLPPQLWLGVKGGGRGWGAIGGGEKRRRGGWYVGGTEFKERMLAMVEQPLRQGRSDSYSGEAKRAHGEAEAERLLAHGLAARGLAEGQLAETRKGAWEKEVLAWWLCQH